MDMADHQHRIAALEQRLKKTQNAIARACVELEVPLKNLKSEASMQALAALDRLKATL